MRFGWYLCLLWMGWGLPAAEAQVTVNLSDLTLNLKPKEEKVFSYSLKEGDQLILEFATGKGKEIQSVTFGRAGNAPLYQKYRLKSADPQRITILKSGTHTLRIYNGSGTKRVCTFKLMRLLEEHELKAYASEVLWRTLYDTLRYVEQERYLFQSDTHIVDLTNKVVKVNSKSNKNGHKTSFSFALPQHTIVWSYYIGVDQEGEKAFQQAVINLSKAVTPVVSKIPNYGPLAALALGGASFLTVLKTGENIKYYIVRPGNEIRFSKNQDFKYLKKGNVVNDFSRLTQPLSGIYHVCLENDNMVKGVQVSVKIVAITVENQWKERPVQKMKVSTRQVPYQK